MWRLKSPDNKKLIVRIARMTAGNTVNYTSRDIRRVDLVAGVSCRDDPLLSALALVAHPRNAGQRLIAERIVLDDAKPAGSFCDENAVIRHGNNCPWTLDPFKDNFDLVLPLALLHGRDH